MALARRNKPGSVAVLCQESRCCAPDPYPIGLPMEALPDCSRRIREPLREFKSLTVLPHASSAVSPQRARR